MKRSIVGCHVHLKTKAVYLAAVVYALKYHINQQEILGAGYFAESSHCRTHPFSIHA